jgi:hypothetical protein
MNELGHGRVFNHEAGVRSSPIYPHFRQRFAQRVRSPSENPIVFNYAATNDFAPRGGHHLYTVQLP